MSSDIELAKAWILAQRLGPDTQEYEKYSWASDHLINSVFDSPDRVFEIILAVIAYDSSERTIASIGAGPLEDLIVYHGEEFVERIETEASRSPAFKAALSHVWLEDTDTLLKERFLEAGKDKIS